MFGILKKAKNAGKVNLSYVASSMNSRYWSAETIEGKEDTILVNGKYRNNRRDFFKLYLKFVGANVRFTDQRGSVISEVPKSQMYPELKEIMNVV